MALCDICCYGLFWGWGLLVVSVHNFLFKKREFNLVFQLIFMVTTALKNCILQVQIRISSYAQTLCDYECWFAHSLWMHTNLKYVHCGQNLLVFFTFLISSSFWYWKKNQFLMFVLEWVKNWCFWFCHTLWLSVTIHAGIHMSIGHRSADW